MHLAFEKQMQSNEFGKCFKRVSSAGTCTDGVVHPCKILINLFYSYLSTCVESSLSPGYSNKIVWRSCVTTSAPFLDIKR